MSSALSRGHAAGRRLRERDAETRGDDVLDAAHHDRRAIVATRSRR